MKNILLIQKSFFLWYGLILGERYYTNLHKQFINKKFEITHYHYDLNFRGCATKGCPPEAEVQGHVRLQHLLELR